MNEEEKKQLATSINDIVHEGPRTVFATTRIKKLIAKVRGPAVKSFKKILVDIVSEAVKRLLLPKP